MGLGLQGPTKAKKTKISTQHRTAEQVQQTTNTSRKSPCTKFPGIKRIFFSYSAVPAPGSAALHGGDDSSGPVFHQVGHVADCVAVREEVPSVEEKGVSLSEVQRRKTS
jgi:hypothetical protein